MYFLSHVLMFSKFLMAQDNISAKPKQNLSEVEKTCETKQEKNEESYVKSFSETEEIINSLTNEENLFDQKEFTRLSEKEMKNEIQGLLLDLDEKMENTIKIKKDLKNRVELHRFLDSDDEMRVQIIETIKLFQKTFSSLNFSVEKMNQKDYKKLVTKARNLLKKYETTRNDFISKITT
ncbi:hypothetical protein EDEG_00253 [Edhazardia aedis USNM 41457]|uniref:BAG domain-containing protein n=1 Tax=Edhazardia aedis (strain USNM 41457) TaxID=1003232 RepID=J9D4Q9_EDHAE|nr:hypothetical protein EDEG_00253 [Edhazardia aedis USNM 41457]|eukprot:EJW02796.1 hypothetical protein EDEG_00253 [Edhazardia aedis USNM 41457]